MNFPSNSSLEGILLVDKAYNKTSFSIVYMLRKVTKIQKIGHTGTLDPLATGLMVMLIGKKFTSLCNKLTAEEKEYSATFFLGQTTDTYDAEGVITSSSNYVPSLEEVKDTLLLFQGNIKQIPPMFSAKKINGKKFYELARRGIQIDRSPTNITVNINLIKYQHPELEVHITCSKGTYVRTLAHDIGQKLRCGAYLKSLKRTRCGIFQLQDAVHQDKLLNADFQILNWLKVL